MSECSPVILNHFFCVLLIYARASEEEDFDGGGGGEEDGQEKDQQNNQPELLPFLQYIYIFNGSRVYLFCVLFPAEMDQIEEAPRKSTGFV